MRIFCVKIEWNSLEAVLMAICLWFFEKPHSNEPQRYIFVTDFTGGLLFQLHLCKKMSLPFKEVVTKKLRRKLPFLSNALAITTEFAFSFPCMLA